MTLPAKKYRSWKERERRGKVLLALIIVGVVGVIILLVVHGEVERISIGIPIENAIGAFLVQLLIMGSLVPVYLIFNKISPGWGTRRHEKYSGKLLIIFIIAVVISVVTSYLTLVFGPDSIFVKSQQGSDYINIGNKLFNDGKYQEAISYYDRALIREPDNVQVINQKGVALSLLWSTPRGFNIV